MDHGLILTPGRKHALPDLGEANNDDPDFKADSTKRLLEIMRQQSAAINRFWTTWREEYLLSLRTRLPLQRKSQRQQLHEPQIGEVVLVKDPKAARGFWKFGRISAFSSSSDGAKRSARVTLPNSKSILRPVCHLYPLEIQDAGDSSGEPGALNAPVEHTTEVANCSGDSSGVPCAPDVSEHSSPPSQRRSRQTRRAARRAPNSSEK